MLKFVYTLISAFGKNAKTWKWSFPHVLMQGKKDVFKYRLGGILYHE